ncbi:MAG: hypothetical protein V7K38_15155 [Nostoc sp.]|uniref:hypothetical protein n=1 Tax=Nostoc sp. TaxID=1180 RepID=UPI002FF5AD8F
MTKEELVDFLNATLPILALARLHPSFFVDYRSPLEIRIAPHFYNTLDEVEAVMLEMRFFKENLT